MPATPYLDSPGRPGHTATCHACHAPPGRTPPSHPSQIKPRLACHAMPNHSTANLATDALMLCGVRFFNHRRQPGFDLSDNVENRQ